MKVDIERRFADALPSGLDFCSLRLVSRQDELLAVRQDVLQPITRSDDVGAMITVCQGQGQGYAATSDLSAAGIAAAIEDAARWAERVGDRGVIDFSTIDYPHPRGDYRGPQQRPWAELSIGDKIALLQRESARLKTSDRIIDWEASLWFTDNHALYLTSAGGRVEQRFGQLVPMLSVTANRGSQTQTRTFGSRGYCRQGGLEVLEQVGFAEAAPRLAEEALLLLDAPNCPSGEMDLVLAPDQMLLQIHESIGHPLELDRILGDERNYAGTSFVRPEMFGSYRYGSELLNVTYDPELPGELASCGFDDEGNAARREHLIKDGVLIRGLGSITSQARVGLPGVACARGDGWARPPIDRIGNLNLEPGDASLPELIGAVERGVYLETNCSWSIDDSRNKFQFGCELGRIIEDGQLKGVVRNPNYRGISATFWRNLARVGGEQTQQVLGSPYCGKGEPNQLTRVGHASPACLFENVAVFGAAQ